MSEEVIQGTLLVRWFRSTGSAWPHAVQTADFKLQLCMCQSAMDKKRARLLVLEKRQTLLALLGAACCLVLAAHKRSSPCALANCVPCAESIESDAETTVPKLKGATRWELWCGRATLCCPLPRLRAFTVLGEGLPCAWAA
jgi:hypothetical protein